MQLCLVEVSQCSWVRGRLIIFTGYVVTFEVSTAAPLELNIEITNW